MKRWGGRESVGGCAPRGRTPARNANPDGERNREMPFDSDPTLSSVGVACVRSRWSDLRDAIDLNTTRQMRIVRERAAADPAAIYRHGGDAMTLCPTCGRRGSLLIGNTGIEASAHRGISGGTSGYLATAFCPDAFHDRADHAEEAFKLLKELREQLSIAAHFIDVVTPWPMPLGWEQVVAQADEAIDKARALLARVGRKEEEKK